MPEELFEVARASPRRDAAAQPASATSAKRQSALTRRICSTELQRASSSSGVHTTTAPSCRSYWGLANADRGLDLRQSLPWATQLSIVAPDPNAIPPAPIAA